jgi:hypothetical protein
MRTVTIGVTQMAAAADVAVNHGAAERLVRQAAAKGANVVLVQELFEAPYFCSEQHASHFASAREADGNATVARFAALARELGVAMPVSFFERAGNTHYNTIAMVDADGVVLGHYRKSHIPDGPGYQEKFYFAPGDTGFRVWDTAFGKVASASAGTSGSRKLPARWRFRARSCCSTPPPSALSRSRPATIRAPIGRTPCAGTPPPTSCHSPPPTGWEPSATSTARR